ncbi:hypothetical protein [Parasitella parasitica]|uniref:Uncharacterized protein n=1 Tax=Parasitella parasitica TaxID=35722 RepID=A0A0B7NLL2_9FUNG|nr:hypothetical protein [Parasitella parasitica]
MEITSGERNAWKDLITDKIKVSRKSSALSSAIQSSTSSTTNSSKHNILITEEQRINVLKLYDDLNNENKWKLACSGRYIEDIMKEAVKTAKYEHPSASFIFDLADPIWLSKFTKDEFKQIKYFNNKKPEKINKELEEYFDSFDKEELETARDYYNEASKRNFGFGGSYDQRWIQPDFSEGDLLHHVWLFVYNCFRSGGIEAKLGERGSVASALRRNEKRGLEAVERRERKASRAKVDILFKAGGIHEVGCSEVGKDNVLAIDDKYLDDGMIKLPKTLRHILKELVQVNPSLKMELVIMDIPAGNTVTRINRNLLPLLEATLLGKQLMESLIKLIDTRKRKAFVLFDEDDEESTTTIPNCFENSLAK